MKKYIASILLFWMVLSNSTAYAFELNTSAKSVILMEAETGQVLYEENADEKLPPASVTKIMTVLLVMEAIDSGRIHMEDKVSVSEHAAGMGGSQVYLEPGEQMTVDELLKCVVVASANDAAAALAEYCYGSEEAFVEKMNTRAQELGMENTHFENTNGLDDTTTTHLTTARDIAIMSRELLFHEKIFQYTNIWMDTIRNGSFGLTNTNRLIRFYKGANGLKTGSTSKAGFCISATAKRDGMQLISVVMASPTRDERNQTAVKLLDFGFGNFAFYCDDADKMSDLTMKVEASTTKEVALYVKNDFEKLLTKEQKGKIEKRIEYPQCMTAPIRKGQIIGYVSYYMEGEEIGKTPICAKEEARRYNFMDLFKIAMKKLSIF